MIIDCHTHLNNYTDQPIPLEVRWERLLTAIGQYDVDHALVLSSYVANEARPSVTQIIDLAKDEPRVSVVEGLSLYGKAPFDLAATEERLRRRDVVGLKLYPGYEYYYPSDKVCRPLFELAMEYEVPVMIHTGDTYHAKGKVKYAHPLHVDDVAVDYPDMKIVICHLGNPWFRDTAEVIYKNANVYADISGLFLGETVEPFEEWLKSQVKDIVQFAGNPDKLLYGSDWPLVGIGPYMKLIDSLEFEPEDREKLLWQNTVRVFNLPEFGWEEPEEEEG